MKKYTAFTTVFCLAFISAPASSLAMSCSNLIKNQKLQPGLEHLENHSVLLEIRSPFHFAGRVKLVDLEQEASTKPGRYLYTKKIKEQIHSDHPEIKLSPGDQVLALDVRGERNGSIRTMVLKTISRLALDISGVEPLLLNYRATEDSRGTPRLIFVVKNKVTDYRGGGRLLETQADVTNWIVSELDALVTNFFSEDTLGLEKNFDKIYTLMSRRRSIPTGQGLAHISKEVFQVQFPIAVNRFLTKLSAEDLLHIRSTFWDDAPIADVFATTTYSLIRQNNSTTQFTDNFTSTALSLRERLYKQIHKNADRRTLARGAQSELEAAETNAVVSSSMGSSLAQTHSLSGETSQSLFGSDFLSGPNHQNTQLSDIKDVLNISAQRAVSVLERHGYGEISHLNGQDASKLLEQTNVPLSDLTSLAISLTEHGVYFTYPPAVYFKIPADIRVEIKHPKNSSFGYSTRSNTYSPRSN